MWISSILNMFFKSYNNDKLVKTTKTKKCQPPVWATPVMGAHPPQVGVGGPDGGLTRPKKKSTERKTYKSEKSNYKSRSEKCYYCEKSVKITKTKKCQPPVWATPVMGTHPPEAVGVGGPDGGLARPIKKLTERKKYKTLQKQITSRGLSIKYKSASLLSGPHLSWGPTHQKQWVWVA